MLPHPQPGGPAFGLDVPFPGRLSRDRAICANWGGRGCRKPGESGWRVGALIFRIFFAGCANDCRRGDSGLLRDITFLFAAVRNWALAENRLAVSEVAGLSDIRVRP